MGWHKMETMRNLQDIQDLQVMYSQSTHMRIKWGSGVKVVNPVIPSQNSSTGNGGSTKKVRIILK